MMRDIRPRAISVCSGIGGLDLAMQAVGWRTVCYVERDPWRRGILQQHMAADDLDEGVIWDDLRTFPGRDWRGRVDCLFGGFPCQPFSTAGRRKGRDDERNLWPAVRRAIAQVRPQVVFLENVPGLLHGGDGHEPYALKVVSDLARLGYDARWCIVGARDVGAPHRRERWFCLAYSVGAGAWSKGWATGRWLRPSQLRQGDGETGASRPDPASGGDVADATGTGLSEWSSATMGEPRAESELERPGGVDDTDEPGLERRGVTLGDGSDQWAPWPPGPKDADAWAAVLRERPDLAPAVANPKRGDVSGRQPQSRPGQDGRAAIARTSEGDDGEQQAQSAVRGVAPGLPSGVDRTKRLAALGDAVVPAQALLAWRLLTAGRRL